jgi:putative ABC transport system ATP-binding protein
VIRPADPEPTLSRTGVTPTPSGEGQGETPWPARRSAPTMSVMSTTTSTRTENRPAPDGVAPILQARGVTKTYRSGEVEVHALRGIDLDLRPGELTVIMGPSGNGKTTLLNCLSGLDDIDAGSVVIDGRDITALSDRARTAHRAARMGFVFQSFNLIPVFDAVENVELPLLAAGARPRAARERARDLLDRVGLGHRVDHRPNELSGGEQQRVAIARALVTTPAIVWADEPTGNLDSTTAAAVVELFRQVNAAGQTVVMVTHDPAIARPGDRLIEVRDGRVAADRITGVGR